MPQTQETFSQRLSFLSSIQFSFSKAYQVDICAQSFFSKTEYGIDLFKIDPSPIRESSLHIKSYFFGFILLVFSFLLAVANLSDQDQTDLMPILILSGLFLYGAIHQFITGYFLSRKKIIFCDMFGNPLFTLFKTKKNAEKAESFAQVIVEKIEKLRQSSFSEQAEQEKLVH
ncbi:MAG TPA: hypothetical protein PKC21_06820 [Oligoflexia bacterium]|nr:hypothetical protein [Oligoflexia bacterium]HMR25049.1 hypothetical protein [Oligoflexia bacterium]